MILPYDRDITKNIRWLIVFDVASAECRAFNQIPNCYQRHGGYANSIGYHRRKAETFVCQQDVSDREFDSLFWK